jgi:hypothetical protein
MAQSNGFLQGWRSLPDELKLMVLSFALPSGQTLGSTQFDKVACSTSLELVSRRTDSSWWVHSTSSPGALEDCTRFDHGILPFLACPEIVGLVIEVLYQNNTTETLLQNLCLPPPTVRRHIRKIKLSIQVHTENFCQLAKLFNGNLARSSLELVEVKATYMPGTDKKGELSALNVLKTICVPTKQLCVSLLYDTDCFPFIDRKLSKHEVGAIVLPKFTVEVHEGKEAKECYEPPPLDDHKDDDGQYPLYYFFSSVRPGERECCRTWRKSVWI